MKIRSSMILGLVCIILAASLLVSFVIINQKNRTIITQEDKINDLENKLDSLRTLVFHVSEKGEDYPYARLPNASDIYRQILTLNNDTYKILLMPEYKGYSSWTETLHWLTDNFGGPQGIPLMLPIFGGGENSTSTTPKLTVEQIVDALEVSNVKWLRIAEVCSWYIEHNQSFPYEYVRQIFEFCKTNNLGVLWTEWKNDYPNKNHETFTAIQAAIQDYEDVVTVSFSTNSNELEPADGFLKLKDMFQKWGASIQPWYWNTTKNSDLMNMPPSLLLEHTITAKGIGAEVLQFEPYWYFFNENGQTNKNMELLLKILT
ncbi:MAG: hypothetical protein IAX22_05405 [Candidatus Bathyarchaeota archaeon]|nr:hypothetical protein [Candidatus Bathyarchaeota archaeon]